MQGDAVAAVAADDLPTETDLVLVVPGEDVLICDIALPPIRQAGRRRQAARFQLEERLAQAVEDVHLVLGARLRDGGYPAAVVAHARMRAWLDALGPARDALVAVVPDYLCLPQPGAGSAVLVTLGERALLRRDDVHGFACEAALAPALLAPAATSGRIMLEAGRDWEPGLAARLDEIGCDWERVQADEPATLRALITAATGHRPINLLQENYAPTHTRDQWWRPLRATAALAALWLVLAVAAQALTYEQLTQRYARYQQMAETSFRRAFPGVGTINDMRVQAELEIRRLRAQQGSGGLFPLLAATAAATSGAAKLRLESLQYRNGELHLSLRGESVQSVEALRAGFAQHPTLVLEIQSADASNEGVRIRARVSRGAAAS